MQSSVRGFGVGRSQAAAVPANLGASISGIPVNGNVITVEVYTSILLCTYIDVVESTYFEVETAKILKHAHVAHTAHTQKQRPHTHSKSHDPRRVVSLTVVRVAVKLLLSQPTWELVSLAYQ